MSSGSGRTRRGASTAGSVFSAGATVAPPGTTVAPLRPRANKQTAWSVCCGRSRRRPPTAPFRRFPVQSVLYEASHVAFRAMVRDFLAKEVVPHHEAWAEAGIVDRSVWLKAGEQGLLGMDVPEEYGGGGVNDFRYNAVLAAEVSRVGASGLGFTLHNDVVAPYLTELCTDEQKTRWLPGFVAGEIITAIAMSEPGAGSDLQGLKTTAVRDGDDWILNGSKTFITNGINSHPGRGRAP